jgi:hypothetical protein
LESAKKAETRQRRFKKLMDKLIRKEKPDFGFNKGEKDITSDCRFTQVNSGEKHHV